MKLLGVSGVFDYAGLSRSSRYRACSCCLPRISRTSASGLTVYGAEYPPRLSSVYASLGTSRYPAQDSRPSGSLLLSRKELSSSASCRFIPAHWNRLLRHMLLAVAALCIGSAIYALLPAPDLRHRISLASAYVAIIYLAISLALGPYRIWRKLPNPISFDLRRDIG